MASFRHVFGRVATAMVIAVMLGAATLLAGCNTIAGAGKDISSTGQAVTGGADQTKQALPPAP